MINRFSKKRLLIDENSNVINSDCCRIAFRILQFKLLNIFFLYIYISSFFVQSNFVSGHI